MVKFILGCFAVVVCTFLGKKFTDKYLQKLLYYESLQSFNLNLKSNLRFKRDSILNLLDNEYKCKDFCLTLQSFKTCVFTDGKFSDVFFPDWFDLEDLNFLTEYLLNLGKGNSSSEKEFIDAYQILIDEKLVKIKDNNCKFSKLGKRLGFSVGMAVFILIL